MIYRTIKFFNVYLKFNPSNTLRNASRRTMCSNNASDHIVWMDMEMTGLDIETDHILEVTCAITNSQLKTVSDTLNIVINVPESVLSNMNSWCKETHEKTKLIQRVRDSKIGLEEAERTLLEYLKKHVPQGKCPLGGNSVYIDRFFLMKHMALVNNYLSYRIIDVSSIKELARRWNPECYKSAPPKLYAHVASLDIQESINELKYYKKFMFLT